MKQNSDLPSLIDEYGDLQAELAAMKPKEDRFKLLRDLIQAKLAPHPPNKDFIESGTRYDLVVSECQHEREFLPNAMKKLAKLLGNLFWPLCKVTLKDFDNHVALPSRKLFVTETQTGSRRLKAIATAQVKAA